jgi:twitching motility protein PilT
MSSQVFQGVFAVDDFIHLLKDFDCSYSVPGVSRFRVNICRQRGTFSIVLRIVPFVPPTIENLGLPLCIKSIAMEERGLVLITGITGSGKSTTLTAMINHINNNRPCKIVTIEDPIEFLHKEIKASVISIRLPILLSLISLWGIFRFR